jgi:restriction endonuclease S subunit
MSNDAIHSVTLGEIAGVASGYPLRCSTEDLESGDVHFVQLKNTSQDAHVNWAGVPKVTLPSKRQPVWLSDDDVLFASRGTKTLAYPLTNTPSRAVCAPQFFVLTVRDTRKLSPEFLAWQINQKTAQDYFQRTATGSYIQNIRRSVLENLPIVVPALHRQHLIVKFLQAAQHERATLNRLIENRNNQLEALAFGLLQQPSEAKS